MKLPKGNEWLSSNIKPESITATDMTISHNFKSDSIVVIDTIISPSTHVLRLRKAIYGLKTAPRLWYRHINAFLRRIGFVQSDADSNIYNQADCLLMLYVDDLLLAYDPAIEIQHVKRELQNQYKMIDLSHACCFLAIELSVTRVGFQLNQTFYIDTVLRRFGLQDCNSVATPLDKHSLAQLQNPSELSETLNPGKTRLYQSIVGSIMYIMLRTRLDLAFTTQSSANLSQAHVQHISRPQSGHSAI